MSDRDRDPLFAALRESTPPHDVEAGRRRLLAHARAASRRPSSAAPSRPSLGWLAAAAVAGGAAVVGGYLATRRLEPPPVSRVDEACEACATDGPAETTRAAAPELSPTSAPSASVPPRQPAAPPVSPTSAISTDAPVPPAPSWTTFEERGDYDGAYAAASSAGLASLHRASSADELLRLAQVARLSGHRGSERDALLACRARFPGSEPSAVAAYELGRAAGPDGAAAWFETYLREAPAGPLAREASGRALEAHAAARADGPARAAAERYLARYPDGPHAALARRVLAERRE